MDKYELLEFQANETIESITKKINDSKSEVVGAFNRNGNVVVIVKRQIKEKATGGVKPLTGY